MSARFSMNALEVSYYNSQFVVFKGDIIMEKISSTYYRQPIKCYKF